MLRTPNSWPIWFTVLMPRIASSATLALNSPVKFLRFVSLISCSLLQQVTTLIYCLKIGVHSAFPLTPPPPQRPSEAKAWPHPSALPPLALGKPASPRTVHWLAPCIASWFAQRRARRGNAYSVGYADFFSARLPKFFDAIAQTHERPYSSNLAVKCRALASFITRKASPYNGQPESLFLHLVCCRSAAR